MPCSCFGKKDKKAAAAADKYSRSPELEPLSAPAQAPAPLEAPTQAPAPAQTEAAPATPPTPVTPTSADARLRPEDDPDKASRRRDVVASFYSDQCELIGFKATGSRPPSAVVGGAGENPVATSSPVGSPPSSLRTSALSRADLALKRREFFKDLAVNDLNSSRYGASEPSWRLVESGSHTTPRRAYQQDGAHHHTLPLHARAGIVLRPVSSPAKATSGPDLRITNGHSGDIQEHEHRTQEAKAPEAEPLLGGEAPQEAAAHHQEAGTEEALPAPQLSATPATPPGTPATPPPTPPARAEPLVLEAPSLDQPLASEALTQLAASQGEGNEGQLAVAQQYVQQVSVTSEEERQAEGSSILIEEAFAEAPPAHLHATSPDVPDTTTASGSPPAPSAAHEVQAARDVSQHSSEQPATPPPTDTPTPRWPSLPGEQEEEEVKVSPPHTHEATLDINQDLKRPVSSPETSAPGSPQEPRQPPVGENVAVAPLEQQREAFQPQQECDDSPEEARLSPTIVGCIPKAAPSQEDEQPSPSPPRTPPPSHPSPLPAGEEVRPPAPPTQPNTDGRAPPSSPTPPSLSKPRVTCGVDVSSSQQEDDGLGSDIDDALSSLECLSEEGNSEKRATAST